MKGPRTVRERTRRRAPVPGDIVGALKALGFDDIRVTGDEAAVLCPYHDDTKIGNFSVNTGTGVNHCLGGETMVVTWEGPKAIQDLANSTPKLLTSGGWVKAPVHSFGVQQLWDITLTRNGRTKVIRATEGHRWFVQNTGAERRTTDLRRGSRLKTKKPPGSHNVVVSPWGAAHGIVFGDGSLDKCNAELDLWEAKNTELQRFFPLSSEIPIAREDTGISGVRITGLPRYFKQFPHLGAGTSYLYGWLAGYFAADGCVDEAGMPTLASASRGNLEFAQLVATRIGIFTYGIRQQMRRGLGKEDSALYSLSFSRRSLSSEFFLVTSHRERWEAHKDVKERPGWVVQSAEPTQVYEEVFCAQVPEYHDFTLEDFILTGNCFSCGESGQFVRIVQVVNDWSWEKSALWCKTRMAKDLNGLRHHYDDEPVRSGKEDTTQQINEAKLALFTDPPEDMLAARGVSLAAVHAYGVRWDQARRLWVLPIRSPDTGELWGWQEKGKDGVRNRPRNVAKSRSLFGLDASKSASSGGTLILVESPLDCLRLWTAGIKGAVSSFGVHVSEEQLNLLTTADRVLLALDNDDSGSRISTQLCLGHYDASRVWHPPFNRVPLYVYNYGDSGAKDPGEASDEEIRWGVAHATRAFATRF